MTNTINIIIGSNLRAMRKSLGLSQAAVARELGITFQQLQKYESGRNRLSAERLYLLGRHFRVPVSCFFIGLNQPELAEIAGFGPAPSPY